MFRTLAGRVYTLYAASLSLLLAAGLGLFLHDQITREVEQTQEAAVMLVEVVAQAVKDSAVIGDYDTIRRTLQNATAGQVFMAGQLIDLTGGRLDVAGTAAPAGGSPGWLLRWVQGRLYDVNRAITVGGRDYGVLRLRFDAERVATDIWQLAVRALVLAVVGLLASLALMRVAFARWLGGLDRMAALEQRIRRGSVDVADLLSERTPTEIRRVIEMVGRTSTLMRELDQQKFALDQHAIVIVTDAQGRIVDANDRFCAISGHPREALLGRSYRSVASGGHDDAFWDAIWQTVQAGQVWNGEIGNRNRDGTLYWVNASVVPLLGDDGRPQRYIAIQTDISDRKSIEASLEAAKTAAEQANRAKGEFLANMSHEIRTPMNGIIGLSELVLQTPLQPQQERHVRMIKQAGDALLEIINDILDFSKIEANKLALEAVPMDLGSVLRHSLDTLEILARDKGLRLAVEFDPAVPRQVVGDPGRLRQVLLNLVGNAVKFTAEGGVTVRVALLQVQGRRARVQFSVRDTGPGVPPEARERIFQAFSQADSSTTRRYGGTGLGLAICSRLVALMGGRIWLDDQPGPGSCFHFTADLALAALEDLRPEPAIPAPQAGDRADGTSLRVLLAEDNPTNQELAMALLGRWGHEVVVVGDGQAAVQAAGGGGWDVVLMDMQMPVMDGLEATRRIREREAADGVPRVRIVAMTANAMRQDQDRCLAAGMDDYVSKPIAAQELRRKLRA